ncbi:MAG: TolC family protein [Planctomycetota bacterium]|nr:TolC family protein [Planctomycetota bacterium]
MNEELQVNFKKLKCVCISLPAIIVVGCQSYKPSPLSIDDYRKSYETRAVELDSLKDFARSLQSTHDDIPDTFDVSDGISPEEGEVIALFYNPVLRLARLEAGVELAAFEQAGMWKDPIFGFDGIDITSPSAPFGYSITSSWTIPLSGRMKTEKVHANATYQESLMRIINDEWNARSSVRNAWASWVTAEEEVELTNETIDKLEQIDSIAKSVHNAGEINRVQYRLIDIEVKSKRVELARLSLVAVNRKHALLTLLGLPPSTSELLQQRSPIAMVPYIQDSTERMIHANTELAIKLSAYERSETALHVEIKKQFPDIVLRGGYGSEFNDQRMLFGVSIPIPVLNANKKGIAVAKANREVARAEAETTFARLYQELTAAYDSLELIKSQRMQFEDVIIPLLEEQTKDVTTIAELGEVDTFVLIETTTKHYQARKQLLELYLSSLEAANQVRRLLGPHVQQQPSPVGGSL